MRTVSGLLYCFCDILCDFENASFDAGLLQAPRRAASGRIVLQLFGVFKGEQGPAQA